MRRESVWPTFGAFTHQDDEHRLASWEQGTRASSSVSALKVILREMACLPDSSQVNIDCYGAGVLSTVQQMLEGHLIKESVCIRCTRASTPPALCQDLTSPYLRSPEAPAQSLPVFREVLKRSPRHAVPLCL